MSNQKHTKNSVFNAADYVSDRTITAGERAILDKALTRTKVKLFFGKKSGFVASLVSTMEFIWDPTIPTACTNGVFMAWNPDFFLSLDQDTRVTVLAHEAWHVAFQHMLRRGDRDPMTYNHAADYVINGMLKENEYYMDGFPYLLDDRFKGMSTEEVYGILKDEYPDPEDMPLNGLDGDFTDPGDSNGPQGPGNMSPRDIINKAKANITKAATMARMNTGGSGIGSLPGEVQMAIDSFLKAKLPWQAILLNFFEALTHTEYSFRRANRRYTDPILPGKIGTSGLEHLIYYLDISGSISDADIVRFNSEVKYIKDTYNPEKLTLVTFDTEIHDEYVFEMDDEFEKIEVTGRGGTDLEEVFKHAKANNPTAIVIFTDLYVHIPSEAPKMPLIWVCSGNESAEVPYGTLIHIENEPNL